MLQDGTFRNRFLPKTMDGVWIRRCRGRIVSKKGGYGFVNGAGLILGNDSPISKALSSIPILGPILGMILYIKIIYIYIIIIYYNVTIWYANSQVHNKTKSI